MIDYKDLGKRIQTYRKQKGITQQKLSEIIDVVPSNISHIERGTNHVSLPTLVKIAEALDVTIDQLLCGSLSKAKFIMIDDIAELLNDCDKKELEAIKDIIITVKRVIK